MKKGFITLTLLFLAFCLFGCEKDEVLPIDRIEVQSIDKIFVSDLFSSDLACVEKDGKAGYVDANGKTVIDFKYDYATAFYNDVAIARIGDTYYVINPKGEVIFERDYELEFSDYYTTGDYIIFCQNDLYGVMDLSGNVICEVEFEEIGSFYEGVALFSKDDKIGCIDIKGNVILEPKYSYDKNNIEFTYGMAIVQNEEGKYGYIDTKGTEVINCIYDDANYFLGDIALVEIDDTEKIINKQGEVVVEVGDTYDSIRLRSENLITAEKDDQGFYLNEKGEILAQWNANSERGTIEYGINSDLFYIEDDETGTITLYDNSGKLLFSSSDYTPGFYSILFDSKDYSIYLVAYTNEKQDSFSNIFHLKNGKVTSLDLAMDCYIYNVYNSNFICKFKSTSESEKDYIKIISDDGKEIVKITVDSRDSIYFTTDGYILHQIGLSYEAKYKLYNLKGEQLFGFEVDYINSKLILSRSLD